MSNFLAIATATEVLKQSLESVVGTAVPNAKVTTVRPRESGQGIPEKGINLFLYQVTPNAAWRNADLPTRQADGRLVQRPQTALDLHYLLSFYGDEKELETQRLSGIAVRTLHSKPVLTREAIRNAIQRLVTDKPNHFLKTSDLADQVELVKFTPLNLSLEELSKLWSVFFQTPYALSVAYQGTVVLIETEETAQAALPVRERNIRVLPFRQPLIESVAPQMVAPGEPITLKGRGLKGEASRVLFGSIPPVVPDPAKHKDGEIELVVPAGLRAGVNTVQVVHGIDFGTPSDPHRGFESNVAAFVLRPKINAVTKSGGGAPGAVKLTLSVAPTVGTGQRVELLLNERAGADAAAYVIPDEPRATDTNSVDIIVRGFKPGSYFLRLQVDRAESWLDLDPASPDFGPTVDLP